MTCKARQVSDQMSCAKCALTWDMNDPEPPTCKTRAELFAELRALIAPAGFTRPMAEIFADRLRQTHDCAGSLPAYGFEQWENAAAGIRLITFSDGSSAELHGPRVAVVRLKGKHHAIQN